MAGTDIRLRRRVMPTLIITPTIPTPLITVMGMDFIRGQFILGTGSDLEAGFAEDDSAGKSQHIVFGLN